MLLIEHGPYHEYIRFSVRLLNLVKAHAGEDLWTHADAREAATNTNGTGVLYPEELAWLYNELGLACCCEGSMHDAYAVWEQGYEVNKLVEEGEDTGQFIVQSKLHFSHTFMELGNIDSADECSLPPDSRTGCPRDARPDRETRRDAARRRMDRRV